MLGHVTGRSPSYDAHLFKALLYVKCVRSPHHPMRLGAIGAWAAKRSAGVEIHAIDVSRNYNKPLSLLDFGCDNEPTLEKDKVRVDGEPVAANVDECQRAAFEAMA